MAIEIVEPTNTPNEGRIIWNDDLIELEGRINEVELGIDAFSTTSASFVQPAVSATVSVTIDETGWMGVGQPVYMVTGGTYTVSSVTDTTHVVLTNLGYSGNAAVGATVASGKKVSPSGFGDSGGFSGDAGDLVFTPAAGVAATDVQAAIEEVAGDVTSHTGDTTDAHDASAISYAGGTGMSATDAEAAIDELATEKANAADLTAHTGDTSDAHDASAISVLDSGSNFAATDVEAALAEEADARQAHEADTTDAHDASAISFVPAGTVAATNVQAAIEEVASESGSGPAGADAFSVTNGSFTQPAVNSTVSVNLSTTDTATPTDWIGVDQILYVEGGGYYQVDSVTDADTVVLENLGYTGNAAPSATVATAAKVSPGGVRGATGATGGGANTLDDLTDVVISSPSDDQYLRYTGTNWVNETVSGSGGHRTPVTLGSDVANATTSFADVTGLSFSATSGVLYRFDALIMFDASAATIGSKWSLNGPASPTALGYHAMFPASNTQISQYYANTYDQGANTASSAFTTGNVAQVHGFIKTSTTGTVIIRLAAETGGTITAKAGSTLEYW